MKVLSVTKTLLREDVNKHFEFPFSVQDDFDKMFIKFSYQPKQYDGILAKDMVAKAFENSLQKATEEDIKNSIPVSNLLTLSLDSPSGHVGNVHRQNNDVIYSVSEYESSPGFYSARIEKGLWRIIVSTHAVVSDSVSMSLEIDCE